MSPSLFCQRLPLVVRMWIVLIVQFLRYCSQVVCDIIINFFTLNPRKDVTARNYNSAKFMTDAIATRYVSFLIWAHTSVFYSPLRQWIFRFNASPVGPSVSAPEDVTVSRILPRCAMLPHKLMYIETSDIMKKDISSVIVKIRSSCKLHPKSHVYDSSAAHIQH